MARVSRVLFIEPTLDLFHLHLGRQVAIPLLPVATLQSTFGVTDMCTQPDLLYAKPTCHATPTLTTY
jgi:hypothetical protein